MRCIVLFVTGFAWRSHGRRSQHQTLRRQASPHEQEISAHPAEQSTQSWVDGGDGIRNPFKALMMSIVAAYDGASSWRIPGAYGNIARFAELRPEPIARGCTTCMRKDFGQAKVNERRTLLGVIRVEIEALERKRSALADQLAKAEKEILADATRGAEAAESDRESQFNDDITFLLSDEEQAAAAAAKEAAKEAALEAEHQRVVEKFIAMWGGPAASIDPFMLERVKWKKQPKPPRAPKPPRDGRSKEEIEKALEKSRRRVDMLPTLIDEVHDQVDFFRKIGDDIRAKACTLEAARAMLEKLGLDKKLENFDVDAEGRRHSSYGRPDGFNGLVINSPKGIPILVDRTRRADRNLRRISRPNDLWFQVRHRKGSRVLLRTSVRRDLKKSPRECMEYAAMLAAYFSEWRYMPREHEAEVIWTDTRHISRGPSHAGRVKKRLGSIWASPYAVDADAKAAQEIQGYLPFFKPRKGKYDDSVDDEWHDLEGDDGDRHYAMMFAADRMAAKFRMAKYPGRKLIY